MNSTDSIAIVCAIYVRVSTEEQARTGYSLPEQRERCQSRARDLVGSAEMRSVIFEDAAGGDILERPGLEQVRAFVREQRPRYFICLDPDRFSRKLILQLLVTEEIEAVGTEIVFVQHDYQKTPEGIMFYQMRGAFAQYEKAKILQRTKAGARRKLFAGQVANGTRPYGYRYNKESDTLEVLPQEAVWVEQIFRWAAAGALPTEIAARLESLGVATRRGGPWRPSTIRQMLRNSTYAGKMVCLRWNTAGYKAQRHLPRAKRTLTPKQRPEAEWITIRVAQIVEESLFAAVQALLPTHKRQAQSGAGLLSSIASCGLCGGAIHYIKGRNQRYLLRCQNRYPRKDGPQVRCTLPVLRADLVEAAAWQALQQWVSAPDALAQHQATQRRNGSAPVQQRSPLGDLASLSAQLAIKRKEQGKILRMVARELVDSAVAEPMLRDLRDQIGHLEEMIKQAQVQQTDQRRSMPALQAETDSISAELLSYDQAKIDYILQRLDLKRRHHLLSWLVQRVLIFRGACCDLLWRCQGAPCKANRIPSGT